MNIDMLESRKKMNNKNRVFVTGDCHGLIDINKLDRLASLPLDFTLDDIVIIAGDAGFVWYKNMHHPSQVRMNKILNDFPFTIFVVLGNHENYDAIEKFPRKDWFGGKVRYNSQTPNIYYAERGEIYYIYGKSYWCFGGAWSVDQFRRTKHLSWWEQELPTEEEMMYGMRQFIKYNGRVDNIITHDCPAEMFKYIPRDVLLGDAPNLEPKNINLYFDRILDNMKFTNWYCGHYHFDGKVESEWGDKIQFLYNDVIMIDEGKNAED